MYQKIWLTIRARAVSGCTNPNPWYKKGALTNIKSIPVKTSLLCIQVFPPGLCTSQVKNTASCSGQHCSKTKSCTGNSRPVETCLCFSGLPAATR